MASYLHEFSANFAPLCILTLEGVMKSQATISFFGSLNDFLPQNRKNSHHWVAFEDGRGVKDLVESLGVPHSEIDVLIVNGTSVNFGFRLNGKSHIEVYPCFTAPQKDSLLHLQPPVPENPSFILDVHLGKLTHLLRMMGFDSLYRNNFRDKEIVEIAHDQNRIILTRDKGILKYRLVSSGYWVRSTDTNIQIKEVTSRFSLCSRKKPFTICMECNGKLKPVQKQEIESLLEENTVKYFTKFAKCSNCGKIYWEGSHYLMLRDRIGNICAGER